MDRLEAMTIVLAVAEAGSLAAAARRLNLPVATASRKISDLEAHLRARLFDRSARKLALTEAGSAYVAAAKRILADLTEAERTASGGYTAPTGDLIITAPSGLGRAHLVPVLAEFLAAYPDIDIQLSLDDRVLNLSELHFDVALRIGVLPDSRLIALRLGTIRRLMCASPAYLAARGTPSVPEDLISHDCISYPELLSPDTWTFHRDSTEIVVPVPRACPSPMSMPPAFTARAGIGIAAAFCYHVSGSLGTNSLKTSLVPIFSRRHLPVSFVHAAGQIPADQAARLSHSHRSGLKARLDRDVIR